MEIYKGNIISADSYDQLNVIENGYVVVENGFIKEVLSSLPSVISTMRKLSTPNLFGNF